MSEICTASLLPADFAHFSCGKGAKRSDYWLTKRSGGISSPGAKLLPGTGHLKWRHVYVIMITEFDYFEHDHILYTVGEDLQKRKKYPSCCAMLTLPHFSSVRKTEKERVRIGSGTSTELSANNGAFMIVTIKGKRNG